MEKMKMKNINMILKFIRSLRNFFDNHGKANSMIGKRPFTQNRER